MSVHFHEVTDPVELERARRQRDRFEGNVAWFRSHADEVYSAHRGRAICVAGQHLFVADTPAEAHALARAAHPEDDGGHVLFIPRERIPRIYAV